MNKTFYKNNPQRLKFCPEKQAVYKPKKTEDLSVGLKILIIALLLAILVIITHYFLPVPLYILVGGAIACLIIYGIYIWDVPGYDQWRKDPNK